MARQKTKLIDPVDVDADGIAEAQAVAGAGSLSLDGALVVGGIYVADYPRQISITSDGADGGRTFTVTGKDPDGKAQTEDITGPATATVESAKYWSEVSDIAADAACAGNISSGTVDEIVTSTIPLDKYNHEPALVSCEEVTGTIDFTVEETFTDFQNTDNIINWYAVTALTNKTSDTRSVITNQVTGVRLKVNSYTNSAQLDFVINQVRPC